MHANEFCVGQQAVYPCHGLGVIESIKTCAVGGITQEFYVLKIHSTGVRVMVPRTAATSVGMRQVVTACDVLKIHSILRSFPMEQQAGIPWNRRLRNMTLKINSGNLFHIAEVLRDLTKARGGRVLGYSEKKMFEKARDFLVGELALVCANDAETIKKEVTHSLAYKPTTSGLI